MSNRYFLNKAEVTPFAWMAFLALIALGCLGYHVWVSPVVRTIFLLVLGVAGVIGGSVYLIREVLWRISCRLRDAEIEEQNREL